MNNELRDLIQLAADASERTALFALRTAELKTDLGGLEAMVRESLTGINEMNGSLNDTVERFRVAVASSRESIADRLAAATDTMEEWVVSVDGGATDLEKIATELHLRVQGFEANVSAQNDAFASLTRQVEQVVEAARATMSSGLADVQAATNGCAADLTKLGAMAADASAHATQVVADVEARMASSNESIATEMSAVDNEIVQSLKQFEEQLATLHDDTIRQKLEEFAERLSEELASNLLRLLVDNADGLVAEVQGAVAMLNGCKDEGESLRQTLNPVIREVEELIEPLAVCADEVQAVAKRVSLGLLG